MNPSDMAIPASAAVQPVAEPKAKTASPRLVSMDVYRGFVMFLMAAEAWDFAGIAKVWKDSKFWQLLGTQQTHVRWVGYHLHDLIQPSFTFMVGVALLYSLSSRAAKGQSRAQMMGHTIRRSFILIILGILLTAFHFIDFHNFSKSFRLTLENTLTQIGLGYTFLVLLGMRPKRDHWIAFFVIVTGYFLFFALYPLPGPDYDYKSVGMPQYMQPNNYPFPLTEFAAHWNKNTNPAFAFDKWLFNAIHMRLPALKEGYCTLSFIPTLATMILGLIASGVMRSSRTPWAKFRWLAIAGLIGLAAGYTLSALGICPLVKRIWTPSWVFLSGGWCFLFLAAFYAVVDIWGCKRWAFLLLLMGMNSIAAYILSGITEFPIIDKPLTKFCTGMFADPANPLAIESPYGHLLQGTIILSAIWLILYVMYKKKWFVRI